MTGFDDRKKTAENKFQLDEEQKFKMLARRDRLFGRWVAQQLGRADADAYAAEVVAAIGPIYSDEILWEAGLRYDRISSDSQ